MIDDDTFIESRTKRPATQAHQALADASSNSLLLKTRLDGLSAQLMLAGEQIPTHGQQQLSAMQKQYLQVSSELVIAEEKVLMLRAQLEST